MNNTFNIARFGKFFAMELRRSKMILLILMGVILIGFAINIASTGDSDLEGFAVFLTLITPFILYNFVYHPTKSFTYSMLPASWLEKFVSAWIMCVIFVPFLLFSFSFLMAFISDLFGVRADLHSLNWRFFQNVYLLTIGFQAIAFCGAFWFRRQKVGKTILTIAITIVALLFLAFGLQHFGVELPENEIGTHIPNYVLYGIVVLLWILSLIKFRRTQI